MNNKVLTIKMPVRVLKGWGYEDIIYNGEEYCGKILHYNKGATSSGHIHKNKHESWFISSGVFKLNFIYGDSGLKADKILTKGMVVQIDRCCYHKVECIEEGDIFEASTKHEDSDTYRFEAGDSQLNKCNIDNK